MGTSTLRRAGASLLLSGGSLVVWAGVASVGASASSTPAVHPDNNRGTYWLKDTNDCGSAVLGAVAPRACASPSHEPHLGCDTIFLIGDGLSAGSGVFDIEIISPSLRPPRLNDLTAYHGTWVDTRPHQPQVIAEVSVATLIADAKAAEQAVGHALFLQPQQGYHFKLELTQLSPGEPAAFQPPGDQKFKTFWVNCAAASTTTTTTTSTSSSAATTTSSTTASTVSSTTTTTTTTATTASASALTTSQSRTTTLAGAVSALTTSTTPTGGVKAVAIPNTGAGGTLGAGLGLLLAGGALVSGAEAIARRRRA